jgi:uncharacterized protein (DUF4213/DUF364 family)
VGVLDDLIAAAPDGALEDVRVGVFWTAVVVKVHGRRQCGLASSLRVEDDHHHGGEPAVRRAGTLLKFPARELAALARSASFLEAGIGVATINALLPPPEDLGPELNAEDIIAELGAGRRVALVGHFPFVPRLRERVGALTVLEQEPRGEDLPASAARTAIPEADVLAVTGTALVNHTFENLLALRRPGAMVVVLGPTTPLSTVLFDHGVDVLSGSVVEEIDSVVRAAGEGANFRQLHRRGVRLVTVRRGRQREA